MAKTKIKADSIQELCSIAKSKLEIHNFTGVYRTS